VDFTSALKPDVFRSFAIYICPGVTAVAPWLYGVAWPDGLWRLLNGSGALISAVILVFCGLTAGLILEELGGCIELHLDKKLTRTENRKGLSDTFYLYLVTPSNPTLVADKFLSATVTRYKFELGMVPALLAAATAFVKMFVKNPDSTLFFLVGLCCVASIYLYREACNSADLLHRIRTEIVTFHLAQTAKP